MPNIKISGTASQQCKIRFFTTDSYVGYIDATGPIEGNLSGDYSGIFEVENATEEITLFAESVNGKTKGFGGIKNGYKSI